NDHLTTLNPNLWGTFYLTGHASTSSNGLTGGQIYTKAVPGDATNDSEETITLHPPNSAGFSITARQADDNTSYVFSGGSGGTFTLIKRVAGSGTTVLASFPYLTHDGMKMGLMVKGGDITMSLDTDYRYTITDSTPI